MITAVFNKIRDSYVAGIHGHAEHAEEGKDIVCAGASAHVFTLAQCVMEMHGEGKLKKEPVVRLGPNPGEAVIAARPKPKHAKELQCYFHMAQVGLTILKQAYPESVDLSTYELLIKEDSE